jgi:CBS domain-containing protein
MRVTDVMTRGAECIRPDATLQEAAERMKTLDIGALPVWCDKDRLLGMVTDRDITIRSVSEGHDPNADRVRDVMTPKVFCCYDDQLIAEAARQMEDNQVRRLVVLNRAKQLVGIVSLGDLAVETGDDELVGNTLEAVSEPNRPVR